jgi:15-cis-phytoene synthase
MVADFEHCMALVREADRDRYLATLFAPAEHRAALYALYAFNVEITRVRDLARQAIAGEIRLQWWRETLAGERAGEAAANPVAAALSATLSRYRLPVERLLGLIDAHVFDLYEEPMATLDDLDRYARATQSALLQTAADILGAADAAAGPLLEHAGIASTIAGMLTLLGRHAARRQLFVPLEVLERHRLDRNDVFAMQIGAPLQDALAELRRHARRQLAAATAELPSAPTEILPALLPVVLAGPTLARMERRDYRPFQFAPPSRLRRQWLLWRAARKPERIFAQ